MPPVDDNQNRRCNESEGPRITLRDEQGRIIQQVEPAAIPTTLQYGQSEGSNENSDVSQCDEQKS